MESHLQPKSTAGFSNYNGFPHDPQRRRQAFDWLVERMAALGFPASHFTLDVKGFTRKLKDLRRSRRALDNRFPEAIGFSVRHVPDGVTDISTGHLTTAGVRETVRLVWDGITVEPDHKMESIPYSAAYWVIQCVDTQIAIADAFAQFEGFADLIADRYGYSFTAPSLGDAGGYGGNVGYSSDAVEEVENASFWGTYPHQYYYRFFLRDIHQVMFLSRPYLDLPVEGTTLEKWVRKDDARGTLRKLNDKITVWTPPPDQIGAIRERLFLSGNLFYHRFFQTWDPENEWVRDFSKPFAPKEVPAIFRADYRRVIDPPVGTT